MVDDTRRESCMILSTDEENNRPTSKLGLLGISCCCLFAQRGNGVWRAACCGARQRNAKLVERTVRRMRGLLGVLSTLEKQRKKAITKVKRRKERWVIPRSKAKPLENGVGERRTEKTGTGRRSSTTFGWRWIV